MDNIQTIEDFARHFRRPPDQLSPEHIREYQAYLFRERKLAASTMTQRLAALRFFYTQTIKKAWGVADTPYPKKTRHPSVVDIGNLQASQLGAPYPRAIERHQYHAMKSSLGAVDEVGNFFLGFGVSEGFRLPWKPSLPCRKLRFRAATNLPPSTTGQT